MQTTEGNHHRLDTLHRILACPQCGAALTYVDRIEVDGHVVDADIECGECGPVGVIRSFQASFHPADLGDAWQPKGKSTTLVPLSEVVVAGHWVPAAEGLLGDGVGVSASGPIGDSGAIIELLNHSWGGAVTMRVENSETSYDLRSDEFGSERIRIDPPTTDQATWTATVTAGRNDGRDQLVVRRAWTIDDTSSAQVPTFEPENRGNPYPARFLEILDDLAADAVIIDVGGGDRRHDDPRVLNFEYMHFDLPDFFGNGLQLPVRSDSVDFILSQAVLEHVPDPQRAVDEIRRILKPGGRIYCEIAFMQPLHAVPFHYFNVTPHGLDLLFAQFDVLSKGTAGGLQSTLDWFFRLVDADGKIGPERVAAVSAALADLDPLLTPDELAHVASFVYAEAIKPE